MHIQKYINNIDYEIDKLLHKEAEGLTASGEKDLHILFENRKNVMRWKKEKGNAAPMMEERGDSMDTSGNPRQSYFGG